MMIKKMYRVFNELHATLEEATKVLNGWEHKEKITEVYAVVDNLNADFINLEEDRSIYLAKSYKEALEEL